MDVQKSAAERGIESRSRVIADAVLCADLLLASRTGRHSKNKPCSCANPAADCRISKPKVLAYRQ